MSVERLGPADLLVWYHVPKTGGTTLRTELEHHLGAEQGVMNQTLGWRDRSGLPPLSELSSAAISATRVVVGHDVAYDTALCFPGRVSKEMTLIREPGSWARSEFVYGKHVINETRWSTFEEYLERRPCDGQAMFLAQKLFGDTQLPREVKHLVRERLDEFWLVGQTNRLDEVTAPLLSSLGLGAPTQTERKNSLTSLGLGDAEEITDELLDEWRRLSLLDSELYEYAKTRTKEFLGED